MLLLGTSASGSAWATASGWPQLGHDAARTGFNPAAPGLGPPFSPLFAFSGGTGVGGNGIVESNGTVLAVGNGGVDVLDATTGLARWHRSGVGRFTGTAMRRGIGYAVDEARATELGGHDPMLDAFRLSDGALLWSQPGGVATAETAGVCASPALTTHALYVSSVRYDRSVDPPRGIWSVQSYDPVSGRPLWSVPPTFDSPLCAPSVAAGRVLVLASDAGHARLVALDRTTGAVRWSLALPDGVEPGQAPVVRNGRVYLVGTLGTSGGHDELVVVNMVHRAVERRTPLPGFASRAPVIDAGGTVYVAACGALTALDARGAILRTAPIEDTEGCGEGQATPLANGFLYVVTFDDAYVFDTARLVAVDDIFVGGFVGSPIVGDARVLIGGDFGVSAWGPTR